MINTSAFSQNPNVFNGYFCTDNDNNIIQRFYNVNDVTFSTNILITDTVTFVGIQGSINDTNNTNKFENNKFIGGTVISSIPILDDIYGSTKWVLWHGTRDFFRLNYFLNDKWKLDRSFMPNTFLNGVELFNPKVECIINKITDPTTKSQPSNI